MELVLLGTGGGPRPTASRFPSAQAVITDDRCILVDAGNGVAQQAARAGIPVVSLTDVLITHLHIDHAADLGILPLAAWVDGRTEPISVLGPPGTKDSLNHLVAGYAQDLSHRMASTGRGDVREQLRCREIAEASVVDDRNGVRIRATLVDHPPFEYALAYRIDTPDGSVVVSGDTAPCDALVDLAQGADVLIHEVVHPEGIERLARATNAPSIREHMHACHTMLEDVGPIAARAGVNTLVLSHLIPHDGITDDQWTAPVHEHFDGQVVVGRDLDRLVIEDGHVRVHRREEVLRG